MKKKLKDLLKNSIESFRRDENQTQIFTPILDNEKYFIKVAGKSRSNLIKNEIKSLKELKKISPFYSKFYIGSTTVDEKTGLLFKYINGIDLYEILVQKTPISIDILINLYKTLLEKIKVFHDHLLNHGDIKAANFFAFKNSETGEVDIELIDTESVNDFSKDMPKPKSEKTKNPYYNIITHSYNIPYKFKRKNIMFKDEENAFSFYKYLDLYGISVFILYLYKKKIYKMIKKTKDKTNPWIIDGKQLSPLDYVDKDSNKLEKALHYVFSFLPLLEDVDKTNKIENIPISTSKILKILK